jgi:hypothetical protein
MVAATAMLQGETPAEMRGRVSAGSASVMSIAYGGGDNSIRRLGRARRRPSRLFFECDTAVHHGTVRDLEMQTSRITCALLLTVFTAVAQDAGTLLPGQSAGLFARIPGIRRVAGQGKPGNTGPYDHNVVAIPEFAGHSWILSNIE